MAIQVVVGLDSDKRERVFGNTVLPCLRNPSVHLSIKPACISIGIALSKENENTEFTVFTVMILTEGIEKATVPRRYGLPAVDLLALTGKPAPGEAKKAAVRLIAAMEERTDSGDHSSLVEALKVVAGKLDLQEPIDLLKWPTSVGIPRATLMEMLERQTNQEFDGNLWKMVTWAQANGLDVKSPPKRPGK
jgi:hypothetical protein